MLAHTCNPSLWEAAAREPPCMEATLGYVVSSRPLWDESEVFPQLLPSPKKASAWLPLPVTLASPTFPFSVLFSVLASAFWNGSECSLNVKYMKTRNSAWCLLSLHYTVGYQPRAPICPFPGLMHRATHTGKQCYVKCVLCNLKYGYKQASLRSKDRIYESQHESMGFANSECIHSKYSFHMRKCGLSADSRKEHDTAKLAPAERKQ